MIIVIIKGTPDIKRAAFILDSKLRGPVPPAPGFVVPAALCPWLFELFHLYTVTLNFPFSTYDLAVDVVECRWYV